MGACGHLGQPAQPKLLMPHGCPLIPKRMGPRKMLLATGPESPQSLVEWDLGSGWLLSLSFWMPPPGKEAESGGGGPSAFV